MKQRKIIQIINGGLIISMLMLCACQTQQTDKTVSEIVIPVVRGTIDSSVDMVGYVQYNQSVELNWKTAGVIEAVNVSVGDTVKKGDILANLEVTSLDSSVILAEKTMIDAQNSLEDVKDSTTDRMTAYQTLNTKESALQTAKLEQEAQYYPRADQQTLEWAWDDYALANLEFNYAKQDYDLAVENNYSWDSGGYPYETQRLDRRTGTIKTVVMDADKDTSARERLFNSYVSTYNTLVDTYETFIYENGVPTDTEFAVAEGNVQVAQQDYDAALKEYLTYDTMPREKDVMTAEINLISAENSYNKRNILASFDGTVTSVSAQEGHYVEKGDSAIRIDDISRMFIPIDVS